MERNNKNMDSHIDKRMKDIIKKVLRKLETLDSSSVYYVRNKKTKYLN
ncbi:MAG: hypothetical protein GX285_05120 [Clostridiales bacterium]|nr:hypothetical protein [Clostridiales bacterium]